MPFARAGQGRRWAAVMGTVLGCAVGAGAAGAADVVRPGDVLAFCPAPDLAAPAGIAWAFRVSADGTVSLGRRGPVRVAGLTPAEAQATIEDQFRQPPPPAAPKPAPPPALAHVPELPPPPRLPDAVPTAPPAAQPASRPVASLPVSLAVRPPGRPPARLIDTAPAHPGRPIPGDAAPPRAEAPADLSPSAPVAAKEPARTNPPAPPVVLAESPAAAEPTSPPGASSDHTPPEPAGRTATGLWSIALGISVMGAVAGLVARRRIPAAPR